MGLKSLILRLEGLRMGLKSLIEKLEDCEWELNPTMNYCKAKEAKAIGSRTKKLRR